MDSRIYSWEVGVRLHFSNWSPNPSCKKSLMVPSPWQWPLIFRYMKTYSCFHSGSGKQSWHSHHPCSDSSHLWRLALVALEKLQSRVPPEAMAATKCNWHALINTLVFQQRFDLARVQQYICRFNLRIHICLCTCQSITERNWRTRNMCFSAHLYHFVFTDTLWCIFSFTLVLFTLFLSSKKLEFCKSQRGAPWRQEKNWTIQTSSIQNL